MGMAASQARYLALVARKSNCEYEGQQINQARLNLSNQTANLFNQMLGLKVPVPPSTNDFTKTQYSFSDGVNAVTLDDWKQLAKSDENYNYVVTYHYNSNVYTGSQKKMNDPQVQFTYPSQDISSDYTSASANIEQKLVEIAEAQKVYDDAYAVYQTLFTSSKTLSTYKDAGLYTRITSCDYANDTYTIHRNITKTLADGNNYYEYQNGWYSQDGTSFVKEDLTPAIMNPSKVENELGTTQQVKIGDTIYDIYTDLSGDCYFNGLNFYRFGINGVLEPYEPDSQLPKTIAGDVTININDTPYTAYKSGDNWYYRNGDSYYNVTGDAAYTDVTDHVLTEAPVQKSEESVFNKYTPGNPQLDNAVEVLMGADSSLTANDFYYTTDEDGKYNISLRSDLEYVRSGASVTLPTYHVSTEPTEEETWKSIEGLQAELAAAKTVLANAQADLELKKSVYETMNVPNYVGNCELTPIYELSSTQKAEIEQIIKDMEAEDVKTTLTKYYYPETGEYKGGIYTFTLNGVTYYSTYDDLADCAKSGTGINHIDDQIKLPYYRADYVSKKIEKTEKALLETDSAGRFTSIRLEDDTMKYTLKVETITDEAAYEDAMNKYYYENAQYDKMVKDINAKTEIIQQEDRTLELKLKQLETEQNALKTEIDAVQKVVQENVEKSFKTFGG